jgi:hypothetical protein
MGDLAAPSMFVMRARRSVNLITRAEQPRRV